jgi:N-methylhydantoinase A/oxoprolinase/acetone carboxylase beta subunit
MSDLVLGIDTGGTYTDGVLLDYHTRQVVATTKTLTTHHDLSRCILSALDALLPQDPDCIKLVSISTTLATNAIAEGKGRPVALFLLGYDPELVQRFKFEGSFATSRFYYFQGGHSLNGKEQAPLDLESLVAKARSLENEVEAFAVSGYFSPFNHQHEELALDAISHATGYPVVLGHQLSSKLNSIQRATTATLNASLLSILDEFIQAMQTALHERGVTAPLMVMRGDGALMGANVIDRRPVETVHSGPAASAIGARFLAGQEKALVIDIGGTTTDIAVLDAGRVTIREEGTTVGPYHTAVRAANIRSVGLGGDSFIAFDVENRLRVGPARVVPISYLAQNDPRVANDLRHLEHRVHKRPTPEHVEYWFIQREPRRFVQNDRARQVLDLLHQRPMSLPEILERLELYHPIQFDGQSLIKEGVIGRAALTPTDLLHLNGRFAPWDVDSAATAADLIARLQGWSVDQLIQGTMQHIAERIVAEVVMFISGQTLERLPDYTPINNLGLWLFEESLYGQNPYLGAHINLKMPLIGIGAPAGIFLPRVAELLDTELILPEHYQVANAVGAVVGSVMVVQEAWILPQMRGMNVVGYYAQAGRKRQRFSRLNEALDYARQTIGEQAFAEAQAAGAVEPRLEFEQLPDGAESYRLRVRAIANPRLSG